MMRNMRIGLLWIAAVILLILQSACANYRTLPEKPDDPEFIPASPKAPTLVGNYSGSVYQPNHGMDSMYADLRAYKVGDVLTVSLSENTTSNQNANTTLNKATGVDVKNPTLFGSTPEFNVPKIIPLASNTNNNLAFKLDSNNTFSGNGTSAQNNNLTGSITVTVSEVLPNGNLIIRGEKWLNLTQGSEFIRLTGMVRPYDIDADNTVASSKIANPRITYRGTGAINEANQEGWLARFFNGPLWGY